MGKVLIAANCPAATAGVASYASELKRRKPETSFTVTSVATPVVKAGTTCPALLDIPLHFAGLESKMKAEAVGYAQRAINRTLAKLKDAGVSAKSVMLIGDPGTEIARYADSKNVDEIVIGVCKPNLLESIFGDDPAQSVTSRVERPVTVIRGG